VGGSSYLTYDDLQSARGPAELRIYASETLAYPSSPYYVSLPLEIDLLTAEQLRERLFPPQLPSEPPPNIWYECRSNAVRNHESQGTRNDKTRICVIVWCASRHPVAMKGRLAMWFRGKEFVLLEGKTILLTSEKDSQSFYVTVPGSVEAGESVEMQLSLVPDIELANYCDSHVEPRTYWPNAIVRQDRVTFIEAECLP